MPALPTTQQSDWSNNIYILTTTRVFVVIGVAYLVKSLYTFVPSIWGTGFASVAAEGIGLGNSEPDAIITVPEAAGPGPNLEVSPTLDLHPPQPIHDPQNRTERSWANGRAQSQSTGVSGQSGAARRVPEQDVGLRNGDSHIEEDMDITVGFIGAGSVEESVMGAEIGGDTSRSPQDTIGPSVDA